MNLKVLRPEGWQRPPGFAYGISAQGRTVFVSGAMGMDASGKFKPGMAGQTRKALENILQILAVDSAGANHIVRMNWYVTDMADYRRSQKDIGRAVRELLGHCDVAMTLVEVRSLIYPDALVEIEATAVVPELSAA